MSKNTSSSQISDLTTIKKKKKKKNKKNKKNKNKNKKTTKSLQTPDSHLDPHLDHAPASHSLPSSITKSNNKTKKKKRKSTPPLTEPQTTQSAKKTTKKKKNDTHADITTQSLNAKPKLASSAPSSSTNNLKKHTSPKPSTSKPVLTTVTRKNKKVTNKSHPSLAQPTSLSVKPVITKKKKRNREQPVQIPQHSSLPQTTRLHNPTEKKPNTANPNTAKPAQSNDSTASYSSDKLLAPPTLSQISLQSKTPQNNDKQEKKKIPQSSGLPTTPASIISPAHTPANTDDRSLVPIPETKNRSKHKKQNTSKLRTPDDSRTSQATESPFPQQPPNSTVNSIKKIKKKQKDALKSTVALQHQAPDTAVPSTKKKKKKKEKNVTPQSTSPPQQQTSVITASSTNKIEKNKAPQSIEAPQQQQQAPDSVSPLAKRKKRKNEPEATVPLQPQSLDTSAQSTKQNEKKNAPQSTAPLQQQPFNTAEPSTQKKKRKKKSKKSLAQSISEANPAQSYPAEQATTPPSIGNKFSKQKVQPSQPSVVQRPLQSETPHPSVPRSSSREFASSDKKQQSKQRRKSLGSARIQPLIGTESPQPSTLLQYSNGISPQITKKLKQKRKQKTLQDAAPALPHPTTASISQQLTARQCSDLRDTEHATPARVAELENGTCAQILSLEQQQAPATTQVHNSEIPSKKTADTQPTALLRRSARLRPLRLMKSKSQTMQESVARNPSPGTLKASRVQSNSNGVDVNSGMAPPMQPAGESVVPPRYRSLEIHKNQESKKAQEPVKFLQNGPDEQHKTLTHQLRSKQHFYCMSNSRNGAQPVSSGDCERPSALTIGDNRKDRNYVPERQTHRDPTPALKVRVAPVDIGNPGRPPYCAGTGRPDPNHMVNPMHSRLGGAQKPNGPSCSYHTQPSSLLTQQNAAGSNKNGPAASTQPIWTLTNQAYLSRKRSNRIVGEQSRPPAKRARRGRSRHPSCEEPIIPQASTKVSSAEHRLSSEQGRSEARCFVTPQTSTGLSGALHQMPPQGASFVSRQTPSSHGQNIRIPCKAQGPQPSFHETRASELPSNQPQNDRNRLQDSRRTEDRQLGHRRPTRRKSLQKKTASLTGEYYGIRCGRDGFSGVITNWACCSQYVIGYCGAVYGIFDTWEKAEEFADRDGTGASLNHKSNVRHFFGRRRNGVLEPGSIARLPWEFESEPKVVSLVTGAAWHSFGIGAGLGGYSVFLSEDSPYNFAGVMEGHVTEIRLHLKATLEVLEIVHQHGLVVDGGVVEMYTVSEEVKNGLDHWLGRWDRTGKWTRFGQQVANQDLWKAILFVREELKKKGTKIHIIWVRGPSKVPAMQRARSLARQSFKPMQDGDQGSFPQASVG